MNTATNEATVLTGSWDQLNLNEVNTDPQPMERTEVQPGTYKFRFVGAKENPYRAGDTDLDFVIIEGTQAKRHVFASLPAPGAYKWVVPAAAILVKRLGGEQLPGEGLIETLNRIAANGAGSITADVADGSYTNKTTGALVYKPKFQFFSVAAA